MRLKNLLLNLFLVFSLIIITGCATGTGYVKPSKTLPADVTVDAAKTVIKFKPYNIFGNNTNGWANPVPVKDKIEAAGNFILRYPGGSWGDSFFWNSKGEYDKDGNWVASLTEYENSTMGDLVYGQENIVDEDNSTAWRSNANTDFPDKQWFYMDLKSKKDPDRLQITWGNNTNGSYPYPKKVTVQYWNPKEGRQWMPYGADNNAWLNTSASNIPCSGGKQEIKWKPVNTQYIRVVMSDSSAGRGGAYAVADASVFQKDEDITQKEKNSIVVSSVNTAVKMNNNNSWIFGFESYMEFMRSFTKAKAEPLIIVNVGSGTPELAAAWVKYANKIKGYGIKYWEIGNENGGQWETGGPMNMYDYTRRYIQYYEAMKAVDPSITILAQAQSDGNSQTQDGVSAAEAFLTRLKKAGKLKYAEGLVSHHYPSWDMHIDDLLASPAAQMKTMREQLEKALKMFPDVKNTTVWVTEFNTSDHVKPHDMSVRIQNSLWLAQYMPEFIRNFGTRGYMNLWDVLNGGSAITKEDGGDHGYMQSEQGEFQYQERADYWAMKMMTNYWSSPGDLKDHTMVDAVSGNTMLAVYANLKPDGSLALLAVNKAPDADINASINVGGYTPKSSAKVRQFDSRNYKWRTDEGQPYHADPSNPPTESGITAGDKFTHTFPPYSITVIEMEKK